MSKPDIATQDHEELRDMLAESAERAFSDLCSSEIINAAEDGEWPQTLWQTLEGLGFTRAAIAEELGGSGIRLADTLPLMRIAGRYAAPLPFGETLIAGWLMASAGLDVPEGPLSFGPVDRRGLIELRYHAGSWVLQGSLRRLPWGVKAKRVALVLPIDSGVMVASVDPGLARVIEGRNLAGEPRDRLEFNQVLLSDSDVRTAPPGIDSDAALLYGALLRGQQMAGALQAASDLAVRYTNERIAFGRPLNKLQAVQQNLAVLAGQSAAANVAADMVLDALAEDQADLYPAVGLAKVRIGDAVDIGARLAHQVHGAMGFTYEYSLQHATRRLWSWRDEFGNEAYWAERIGQGIVSGGADQFWQFVTSAANL